MNQGDTMEQASPVTDVLVERNEDFYDQSYVNDKENTGSEVSSSINNFTQHMKSLSSNVRFEDVHL